MMKKINRNMCHIVLNKILIYACPSLVLFYYGGGL